MTPSKRRDCIDVLGWSQTGFASYVGWDSSTVRRWFREGGKAPEAIDDWLLRRAVAMVNDPPPNREDVP